MYTEQTQLPISTTLGTITVTRCICINESAQALWLKRYLKLNASRFRAVRILSGRLLS